MKRMVTTALVALLFIVFVGTVSAGPAQSINSRGSRGRAGHLYLFEKDLITGEIVKGGAFGIMSYEVPYDTKAMEPFVFTGYRLAPETDFSLICHPASGRIVLGQGKSDESGYVQIAGNFNFGAIPIATNDKVHDGAGIWLVLSRDIGPYQMAGLTPSEYPLLE
jgi:hypothetical protein